MDRMIDDVFDCQEFRLGAVPIALYKMYGFFASRQSKSEEPKWLLRSITMHTDHCNKSR